MRTIIITTTAALLGLIVLSMNLGGCEYRYRYPCQDPQNWGKPECHNAACRADGSCTEQTLGSYYDANSDSSNQKLIGETDTAEPPAPAAKPAAVTDPPLTRIKKQNIPQTRPVISNSCQVTACPVYIEEQAQSQAEEPREQPVTLDTEVDTHIHNLAAN